MTEEAARIVREIRERSGGITTVVGRFETFRRLHVGPHAARGRFSFQRPDKCRSESVQDTSEIITVRNGSNVERRIPGRKEIWKYNLKVLQQALPLNYGVADFADPFFAVDEDSLTYEGQEDLETLLTHRFSADVRNWTQQGVLDTRKGFSIRYQTRAPRVRILLYVASETGLLRRMVGTDAAGDTIVRADYFVEGTNVSLDESLFALEGSSAAYRSIDITDVMLAAMDPDLADSAPSGN